MTLFIITPRRTLEISDAYVMVLAFLISAAIGKVIRAVVKKQLQKRNKTIPNPRGGGLEFVSETELAYTILSCIRDSESVLVKDPRIIKLVFNIVKAKVKNQALVLTPNLMRFLALRLLSNNDILLMKLGSLIFVADNRIRFLARAVGITVLGLVGSAFAVLPYATLLGVVYFTSTANCYKCEDYFEYLPEEEPIQVFAEKSTGQVVIAENDAARQIEIYTPSKGSEVVTRTAEGELKRSIVYKKSRQKAKQVNFSDFKKEDPMLAAFEEEPKVEQKVCALDAIHEAIDNF